MGTGINANDPFNLQRFVQAQDDCYQQVVSELRAGKKRTHWMWFIFPQIAGLGFSSTTKYYAIQNRQEAISYLSHPVLGKRLIECATIVSMITGRTALEFFGSPDDLKLQSSMTLFAAITPTDPVFQQVLNHYYQGAQDPRTVAILNAV